MALIQNLFQEFVKNLQSDNDTEFVNKAFSHFCSSKEIQQLFSCPHTPQQNGLAERKHRHIISTIRTLLITSHAPQDLWVEAALTTVYLINLLPTYTLQWDTPYFRLHKRQPSYSSLRVFGCSCFPHLGPYVSNKLAARSVECVFIGYSPLHKGYKCLDPSSGRVYVSRHVLFNETHFPYKYLQVSSSTGLDFTEFTQVLIPSSSVSSPAQNSSPSPSSNMGLRQASLQESIPAVDTTLTTVSHSIPIPSSPPNSAPPALTHTYSCRAPPPLPASPPAPSPSPELSLLPDSNPTAPSPSLAAPPPSLAAPPPSSAASLPVMLTRSRAGISKPKVRSDGTVRYPVPRALLSVITDFKPTCYSQASQSKEWRTAMAEEINALLKNQTWTLVPPSPTQNIVGCSTLR